MVPSRCLKIKGFRATRMNGFSCPSVPINKRINVFNIGSVAERAMVMQCHIVPAKERFLSPYSNPDQWLIYFRAELQNFLALSCCSHEILWHVILCLVLFFIGNCWELRKAEEYNAQEFRNFPFHILVVRFQFKKQEYDIQLVGQLDIDR